MVGFVLRYLIAVLFCSAESHELIDAELAARVLQLINITDSGIHHQVLPFEFLIFIINASFYSVLAFIFIFAQIHAYIHDFEI